MSQEHTDDTHLQPLSCGSLFAGAYEIADLIGQGARSAVYRARQTRLDRAVAIKVLDSQWVDPSAIKRFQREARTLTGLEHPNILKVYSFGVSDDGQPYIVMELVEGQTLSQVFSSGARLGLDRLKTIFDMVLSGLYHAHEHGIIHGDLKPGNIMVVNSDGAPERVKIIDFGIARIKAPENQIMTTNTPDGHLAGSPAYMSPEQCKGSKIDQRSDIYSLGCVMYEALAGKPPLLGETALQTMYKHVSDTPLSFEEIDSTLRIPAPLANVVFQAMEKLPEHRYQSALEMQEALADALVAGGSGKCRPGKSARRGGRKGRARDSRRGMIIIACLGGFLFCVLLFIGWQKNPPPAPYPSAVDRPSVERPRLRSSGDLLDEAAGKRNSGLLVEAVALLEEAEAAARVEGDRQHLFESHKELGTLYRRLRQWKKAQVNIASALDLFPEDSAKDNPEKAELLYGLATCLSLGKENGEALRRFQQALSMRERLGEGGGGDDLGRLLREYSSCLIQQGKFADGERMLERTRLHWEHLAGNLDATTLMVSLRQAEFLAREMKFSLAGKLYNSIEVRVGKSPSLSTLQAVEIYRSMSEYCWRSGQWRQARRLLEKTLALVDTPGYGVSAERSNMSGITNCDLAYVCFQSGSQKLARDYALKAGSDLEQFYINDYPSPLLFPDRGSMVWALWGPAAGRSRVALARNNKEPAAVIIGWAYMKFALMAGQAGGWETMDRYLDFAVRFFREALGSKDPDYMQAARLQSEILRCGHGGLK